VWPVILQIGPLTVYSFGTMAALGCIAAAWVIEREMNRRDLPGEVGWSIAIWGTAVGFLASAVWYYVQHHFWELLSQPLDTLLASGAAVGEHFRSAQGSLPTRLFSTLAGFGSGFVWYGGLIGGTLAVTWIIYRHHLPWLIMVDCIAPALALAYAIGRVGCLLAGDGDWGMPSELPWAMAFPNAIVGWPPLDEHGVPYPPDVRVHPTPIYEIIACLGIFFVLRALSRRPHANGAILWWYCVLAASERFVIEFWRTNTPVALGLTAAQIFSVLLFAVGAWQLARVRGIQPAATRPVAQPARQ